MHIPEMDHALHLMRYISFYLRVPYIRMLVDSEVRLDIRVPLDLIISVCLLTGSVGRCYFLEQSEHGGDGDNLCVLENMSIDLAPFSDEVLTKKVQPPSPGHTVQMSHV